MKKYFSHTNFELSSRMRFLERKKKKGRCELEKS